MFRNLLDKKENMFDQLDDVLEKRKDFHRRLNNSKHGEEFRSELRKIFSRKLKEKRLGGVRLQARVYPFLMIVLLILLIRGLFTGNLVLNLICLAGIVAFVYSYVSAVITLCGPLAEADLEASGIIEERIEKAREDQATDTPVSAKSSQTSPSKPLTQAELLAKAARESRQRAQAK